MIDASAQEADCGYKLVVVLFETACSQLDTIARPWVTVPEANIAFHANRVPNGREIRRALAKRNFSARVRALRAHRSLLNQEKWAEHHALAMRNRSARIRALQAHRSLVGQEGESEEPSQEL